MLTPIVFIENPWLNREIFSLKLLLWKLGLLGQKYWLLSFDIPKASFFDLSATEVGSYNSSAAFALATWSHCSVTTQL